MGLSLDVDVEEVLRQEPERYLTLPRQRPQVHSVDHLEEGMGRKRPYARRTCVQEERKDLLGAAAWPILPLRIQSARRRCSLVVRMQHQLQPYETRSRGRPGVSEPRESKNEAVGVRPRKHACGQRQGRVLGPRRHQTEEVFGY